MTGVEPIGLSGWSDGSYPTMADLEGWLGNRRSAAILWSLYCSDAPTTQRQIASILGVVPSRVHQIKQAALGTLRRLARASSNGLAIPHGTRLHEAIFFCDRSASDCRARTEWPVVGQRDESRDWLRTG